MSADNGGPAFPHEYKFGDGTAARADGMTLRDYFAAHAPEPPNSWRGGERSISDITQWRWWYADSMLKERDK